MESAPKQAEPPRRVRILAEEVTDAAGRVYRRGAKTSALPLGAVRWLLEAGEVEWADEPPVEGQESDG